MLLVGSGSPVLTDVGPTHWSVIEPFHFVDVCASERALHIDPFADARACLVEGDEQHRRVHVRRFDQRETLAREMKRAAAVIERGHAVA